MHLHSFFLFYLTQQRPLGYALAFIALIFEGDITLFSIAFLTREGFFDVGDMLVVGFLAIFIGDTLWYYAGKHISKYPRVSGWVEKFAKPFDKHLEDNPLKTLLLTKFTYGVHHAVLVRTGMSRMSFKKFIKYDLVAILIWVFVIAGLGYFSSLSLEYLRKYLRYAEVSLLFGLLAFFAIERLLKTISKKEL